MEGMQKMAEPKLGEEKKARLAELDSLIATKSATFEGMEFSEEKGALYDEIKALRDEWFSTRREVEEARKEWAKNDPAEKAWTTIRNGEARMHWAFRKRDRLHPAETEERERLDEIYDRAEARVDAAYELLNTLEKEVPV